MSEAMTFGEIDGQEVELLPARTVLSCYGSGNGSHDGYGSDNGSDHGNGDSGSNDSEANAAAVNYNDIDIYNENESEAEGLYNILGGVVGAL